MKSGDLSLGSARLNDALKKVKVQWELTRTQWRDEVARKFEEEHLTLLEHHLVKAVEAMNRLAQVVGQCRNDVE